MKKNIIIGLALSIGILFPQLPNPCEDEKYLELKKKSLDEMSDREYKYFTQKDKECSEYSIQHRELRDKRRDVDFNLSE